tara:strand:+ start:66 stop:263 length:198 start_codon:yes stop_codon:yes gene_type:complete
MNDIDDFSVEAEERMSDKDLITAFQQEIDEKNDIINKLMHDIDALIHRMPNGIAVSGIERYDNFE